MKIGIDLIEVGRLKKIIKDNPGFLDRILTFEERKKSQITTLAGKIAAKEALLKAGFIKVGQWHKVQILNRPSGEPYILDENGKEIDQITISISHARNYAVAVVLL